MEAIIQDRKIEACDTNSKVALSKSPRSKSTAFAMNVRLMLSVYWIGSGPSDLQKKFTMIEVISNQIISIKPIFHNFFDL